MAVRSGPLTVGDSCRQQLEGRPSAAASGAVRTPHGPARCGGNGAWMVTGDVRSRGEVPAFGHHEGPAAVSRGIGGVPRHLRARLPRAVITPLRGILSGRPPVPKADETDAPRLLEQAVPSGFHMEATTAAMPTVAVASAVTLL